MATRRRLQNKPAFGSDAEYMDPETGLIYLQNRYYSPATAQFLTRDPLDALTRSAYGYVDGNPLNRADPSGLDWGCLGNYCLSDGLKGAANFGAGAADFVTSTLTGGSVRVKAPYCGPGLGVSYIVGQITATIETALALSGRGPTDTNLTPNFENPAEAPGAGWEWRGTGEPGSAKGSWYNPSTDESLHPDLGHGDRSVLITTMSLRMVRSIVSILTDGLFQNE